MTADTTSSASRQHYIDTGSYLPQETTTRRYFVAPDEWEQDALYFGTETEHSPRLVAAQGGNLDRSNAVLPAPLFELVTTVLAPTDDDIDQLAEALWQRHRADAWDDAHVNARDAYRGVVRDVLTVLAGGVLA